MLQLLAGQGVTLETFVVPVGDPDMRLEWFLNKEPLLFKSSFTPVYDYGFVALSITKVAALTQIYNTVRVLHYHILFARYATQYTIGNASALLIANFTIARFTRTTSGRCACG